MTPEYQFYHGALLHEIITTAGCPVKITPTGFSGRPDAYVMNDAVGLLIKHSSSRLSPWTFTFMKDHVAELHSLRAATKICFVGFVCDEDGFVCVKDADLVGILKGVDLERPPQGEYERRDPIA